MNITYCDDGGNGVVAGLSGAVGDCDRVGLNNGGRVTIAMGQS
jgi:hypothetical protein